MIITKTPFRMSFFGGGTDIEDFFLKNGGAVISSTFDKYCYVTVRHLPRFFEYKTHLTYSKLEYVNEYSEISHPLIRNAMKMLDIHEIRLVYDSDLPARSGLGTSSSFSVGMLNAFYCLKGKYASKKRLADESIYLERNLCNEAGGWQDQIAAVYGGLNRIDFDRSGYTVRPIIISPKRKEALEERLIMFFTGFVRYSSDIQKENANSGPEKEKKLIRMLEMVDDAEQILTDKTTDLDDFGRMLDATWRLKRDAGKAVSNSEIDDLYERGLSAGALGGKLLGAGGGGFLLFYVEPEKREDVKRAMGDLLQIPFKFETGGTQVIHYSPEDYEFMEDRDEFLKKA